MNSFLNLLRELIKWRQNVNILLLYYKISIFVKNLSIMTICVHSESIQQLILQNFWFSTSNALKNIQNYLRWILLITIFSPKRLVYSRKKIRPARIRAQSLNIFIQVYRIISLSQIVFFCKQNWSKRVKNYINCYWKKIFYCKPINIE